MGLEITILSKVRKRKTMSYEVTFMWNLKYDTNEFIYKSGQTHKQRFVVSKGNRIWGRIGLGVWD